MRDLQADACLGGGANGLLHGGRGPFVAPPRVRGVEPIGARHRAAELGYLLFGRADLGRILEAG